ncbi:MAG: hypothetical protein F4Z48_04985, partial [Dehalococcoidia bacterium]|nr:hypothetical protein [Dehalococcoidia bacterium]
MGILAIDKERTPTTPQGWSLADTGFTHQEEATLAVWYRFADGSEGESLTLGWTGGKRQAIAAILRYRGVDPAYPVGSVGVATAETNAPTAPSVTATRANARILRVYGADGGDLTAVGGYPAGHEGRFSLGSRGSSG